MTENQSAALTAPLGASAISVYSDISFDCRKVNLYYGSFQALKNIDLRIEKIRLPH